MSHRECIVCKSMYGKPHKKHCPRYVEPNFTITEIEQLFNKQGRTLTNPISGKEEQFLFSSDFKFLLEKFT